MTKDDIIKLAQEAGFVEYELDDGTTNAFDVRYARFAALVAAQEREACAKLAKEIGDATEPDDWALDKCQDIEAAIRARGTT